MAGDVIVLTCRGPLGTGMEETYQLTSALKFLPFGKEVALITDARFSGVSAPARASATSARRRSRAARSAGCATGDTIELIVDRVNLTASVNVVDCPDFESRPLRDDLLPDPLLPDDTRLWAALVTASGGLWGGCVYDTDSIIAKLQVSHGKILERYREGLDLLGAAVVRPFDGSSTVSVSPLPWSDAASSEDTAIHLQRKFEHNSATVGEGCLLEGKASGVTNETALVEGIFRDHMILCDFHSRFQSV